MRTGRLHTVLAATMVLALIGCARPGSQTAGEPGPENSAPITGAADARPAPSDNATGPSGDGPPNHADNNSWKQRSDLTPADRSLGDAAAARIRPALEAQRAASDFSLATTRATLIGLGFPTDRVDVTGMNDPTVVGAVYAVRVGERGCVIGDIRPSGLMLEVTGSAPEFGCLEPVSH